MKSKDVGEPLGYVGKRKSLLWLFIRGWLALYILISCIVFSWFLVPSNVV